MTITISSLKEKLSNDFFKNSFTLITGTSLAQAIPVLMTPFLSRIYKPDEFGLMALFISTYSIFIAISTLRYEMSIMLPAKNEDAINLFALASLISLIISIILLIIVSFFSEFFSHVLKNDHIRIWLYYVPLMVFLYGIYQCLYYWMSRNKLYKTIAVTGVANVSVRTGIQLIAGFSIKSIGSAGLIIGNILGQLSATLLLWFKASKEIFKNFKYVNRSAIISNAKVYKNFPMVNAPHSLVNTLTSNLPVILLTSFFSSKITGLYSLSLIAVMLPNTLISTAIGQVFYQRISNAYNNKEKLFPLVMRLLKGMSMLAILPFLLLLVFAPDLFSIVFGAEWREAGSFTRILVPFLFIRFIAGPLSYIPLILSLQAKAFVIELVNICVVILALFIGGRLNNIVLTLWLLSIFNFAVTVYSSLWIISISKKAN